jgi:tetratricopeptide (TPR) repeat protein
VKRGDWEQAIEIWKPITENLDYKIARKAYFNLAVASEIKGSLQTAIEYAKKAEQMGEKRATSYIYTLKRRVKDAERLKEQLDN